MIKPAAHVFYIGDEHLPLPAADLAALYGVPIPEVENYAAIYFNGTVLYFRIGSGAPTAFAFAPKWQTSLICFGEASVALVFDRLNPFVAIKITGAELFAQEAPVGSNLTIELVDGSGASLGRSITLPAGTSNVRTTWAALNVAANDIVRAKVTAIGSGTPGAWLNLRLNIET